LGNLQFQTLTPNECYRLTPESRCFAVREYHIREGFEGYVNQQTVNIKRSIQARRNSSSFQYYFEQSIRNVARDLLMFLKAPNIQPYIDLVILLPSSKREDDPEYNDKSHRIADILRSQLGMPVSSTLIEIQASHESAHLGGNRTIDFHFNNLAINGEEEHLISQAKTIVLVDDLITSGGHFEGAKARIQVSQLNQTIIGLFWARAIDREKNTSIDDIPF
jgi:hypothetical protein